MTLRTVRTIAASLVVLVVAVSTRAGAPTAHAAAIDLPVPEAIDGTGRTDVTDLLNAFLSGAPSGAVVSFVPGGRYRIEGTVLVLNRRDMTIDGKGATFFATTDGAGASPGRGQRAGWPRLRQHWRILGGSNVTMRDVTVEGANPNGGATPEAYVPALEGQAGVAIQRTAGVLLDRVRVRDTYGDAVYLTGGATDVTIRDSTFERIGRQAVAIVNAQGVVVEDNEIRGVSRSVFDLEPPGRGVVANVRLRDNAVGDYGNFLLAAGGGGPGVGDIWLERNRVDGGHGVSVYAGVERRRRAGYHILDNTGTGARRPTAGTGRPGLIQLQNLDGVEIRGNRQRVAGVPAVSLDRVCDVTVAGNDFPGAEPSRLVVAPCGGAAAPSTSRVAASTTVPSSAASAPAAVGTDDDDDLVPVLLAGLAGVVAGLGVAAAGLVVWRRRRSGPRFPSGTPPR